MTAMNRQGRWRGGAAAAIAMALALVGCGGGGSDNNPPTQTPPAGAEPPQTAAPTKAQAARFLAQATFGATAAEIDHVVAVGYAKWLDEQMALPPTLHQPSVPRFDDPITPKILGVYPIQSSFWRQAATAPDQLRQRLMFALSEIFVISTEDMNVITHPRGVASYMDVLAAGSLGNYRDLLEGVALHPMMGLYLSHLGNRKEDPASGRIPDENFAREVMQLFSIGTEMLDRDGSVKRDGSGRAVETYGNDDVMGLAKVFTGCSWYAPTADDDHFFAVSTNPLAFPAAADPDRDVRPMRFYPQHHSASEKRFLGTTIAAGTDAPASLKRALDTLAGHANVGPFIGRQLIQRLVSSNPSPAYVDRVATVFADNGRGVRGDMKAVVRAVLLDPEARADPSDGNVRAGKVKEPVLRIAAWMRAFDVKSRSGGWAYYFSGDPVSSIGQAPLQSPSVFNFFRPGYAPPQSESGRAGMVAPELQIASETTVASYLNVVEGTVGYFGTGFLLDLNTDYAAEVALADDPAALVDRVDLLLTAGSMSAPTKALLQDAVSSVPPGLFYRENRARLAVLFAMASAEFIVQK